MPFERPSIEDIDRRVRGDIEGTMDGVAIVRQKTVLAGIARAEAGASHELHEHAAHIFDNIFPDSSDQAQLVRQASFYGLSRKAAALATGTIAVTGDNGTDIPADTRLGSETGVEIATTEAAAIADGTAAIPVAAIEPGTPGNLASGSRVAFLSPIAGLSSEASVSDPGMSGGADEETDAQLRERLLFTIRAPAHGGAATDYIRWAFEVPGVTRAWVSPNGAGLGTVVLYVAVDGAAHGPIPNAADIEAVETHIETRASGNEEREGRPVTAQLFVVAPVPLDVPVRLTATPDDAETRAAIVAEIRELFLRVAAPGGIVDRDDIAEAIRMAPGVTARHLLSPAENPEAALGVMPVLGTVSFA